MPTERPVLEERVFLIRLQNLLDTLLPPQCVAFTLATHGMRMSLLPEIPDEETVVVEMVLAPEPEHEVYDRFRSYADTAHLRVFDRNHQEKRRYVMSRGEAKIVRKYMERNISSVFSVQRSRQNITVNNSLMGWTFDRLMDRDDRARTPEVVLGRIEYAKDVPFPAAAWIVEEVTDNPLFCLPKILQLQTRARR